MKHLFYESKYKDFFIHSANCICNVIETDKWIKLNLETKVKYYWIEIELVEHTTIYKVEGINNG